MRRWFMVGTVAIAVVAAFAGPALPAPFSRPAQPFADVAGGREVFTAHCAMCHGRDATGMMRMHPSLRGAVKRLSREGVEVAIRKGRPTTPPMPAWEGRLSAHEIADVTDYIDSLPDGPRNFANEDGGGGMMGGADMSGMGWALLVVSVILALIIGGIGGFAFRGRRADIS